MRQGGGMSSWRDTTSEQAQADLDQLLETVLPLAEETLGKQAEVTPFGAGVTRDGEITLLQVNASAAPDQREGVLGDLYGAARGVVTQHRAFAFVAEETVEEGIRLRVDLEHHEGTAFAVVADYERSKLRRSVTRTALAAQTRGGTIWRAPR